MAEQLANTIVGFFQNRIPEELIVFVISLLPILELRGGLIAASILGVDLKLAFVISYVANMLPIPFILLFIRKVFKFLRNKRFFGKIIRKLEERSERKSETVKKYGKWSLLIFVASTTDTQTKIQQEEIEDYIWLNYTKAIKTLKFENDRSILERAHEFLVRTGVIDAD